MSQPRDATFVTCRHCPFTAIAVTYAEAMDLLEAHQCPQDGEPEAD